jgi:hypothetical protein
MRSVVQHSHSEQGTWLHGRNELSGRYEVRLISTKVQTTVRSFTDIDGIKDTGQACPTTTTVTPDPARSQVINLHMIHIGNQNKISSQPISRR